MKKKLFKNKRREEKERKGTNEGKNMTEKERKTVRQKRYSREM